MGYFNMDELLKVAIEAVKAASHICTQVQHQLVSADTITKKDRSPVTIADYASQAVICRKLKEHYFDIPIVGEEDAASLRESGNQPVVDKISSFLPGWSKAHILDSIDAGNGQAKGRYWTLDPIDGTKGFLRGDQYAVALALIDQGEIELGVLGCPNLPFDESDNGGTIMYAVKGQGSFAKAMNRDETRTAKVLVNKEKVRFLESVESGHANHGLQADIMRFYGERSQSVRFDSQVKYAVLAQGMADVYLRLPNNSKPDYREKIWDHAAGVVVVREAGGRATDMHGKTLDFKQGKQLLQNRGVIVTNGTVHNEIIQIINKSVGA